MRLFYGELIFGREGRNELKGDLSEECVMPASCREVIYFKPADVSHLFTLTGFASLKEPLILSFAFRFLVL